MERYSRITDKNRREIVLLRAFPCAWGKCTFCDYIEDNGKDETELVFQNREVLKEITGEFGVLEVINSGSCFELPKETLEDIRKIVEEKGIRRLIFESHWIYRKRLQEMRNFFGIPVTYKIGIETFDHDFRENVLNKHADFQSPEEVAAIMDLLERYLHEAIETMARDNVRLKFLGDVTPLRPDLRELIQETNRISAGLDGCQANICLNYGVRDEILLAVRPLLR